MYNIITRGVVFAVFFNFVLQLKFSTKLPNLPNNRETKKHKKFIKNILFYLNFIRTINHHNDTLLQELFDDNGTLIDEESVLEWFAQGLYAPNATRRQSEPTLLELVQAGQAVQKREESFYEIYWKSSEWVFLRTGTPLPPKKITDWYSTTVLPINIYRACDRSCSTYFKVYGQVCGIRFDTHTYIYEFHNFDSICDIELENCKDKNKRPSK